MSPSTPPHVGPTLCQVCGRGAHGVHFSVVTCRACAAFFRRSLDDGDRYKCLGASRKDACDATTSNCRSCRFERCKRAGMTAVGLELRKRRHATSTQPPDLDEPCHSTCGDDDYRPSDEPLPEIKREKHKFKYDSEESMAKVLEIFQSNSFHSNYKRIRQTPLRALVEAYGNMVPKRPETVKVLKRVNYQLVMYLTNIHTQRVATWAMNCVEFAQLPLEDKRKMFCNFWAYIYMFERCHRAVEFIKSCPIEVQLLSDDTAIDSNGFDYFLPNMSEEEVKQVNDHFRTLTIHSLVNFQIPFRKLRLTTLEVMYLGLFKMWSVRKIEGLSTQTYEIADKILDQASDELSEFYRGELRLSNYASRLAALFDVVTGLESSFRCRMNVMTSADVAQVYNSDFDDSEFNDFSKYCE